MLSFKNFLNEHEYLFDKPSVGGGDEVSFDRERAAKDFFLTKGGRSARWSDESPVLSVENKRIVVTSYRQPPVVSAIELPSFESKPWGGLWYAEGSEWVAFSAREYQPGLKMFVHEVFVNSERMMVINTADKLWEFSREYGVVVQGGLGPMRGIDWGRVAQEYAGVECFGEGFERRDWQYSWDVPSGVLWDKGGLRDSRLLFVYNVKSKKYESPRELGLYSGLASRVRNPLPVERVGRHQDESEDAA